MTKVLPLKNFEELNPNVDQEKKLRKAAEMYEKHFLNEMVQAMRSTVQHSEMTKPGMGEKIYRQHLDDEYVKSWVGRGGIGLSDMIVNQLREKVGLSKPLQKPSGPLPMESKSNFQMKEMQSDDKKIEYKIQTQKPEDVSAMWNGKVLNHFQHEGKSVVDMEFDNGLKARLLSEGHFSPKKETFLSGEALLNQALDQYTLQLFT